MNEIELFMDKIGDGLDNKIGDGLDDKSHMYLKVVKEILKGTTINVTSIHLIIKTVMEVVEGTPIKGSQQKTLALKILRQLFIDFTDDDIESTLIGLLDSGAISNLIDLIVDASKGKMNINTVVKTTKICCNFWRTKLKRLK